MSGKFGSRIFLCGEEVSTYMTYSMTVESRPGFKETDNYTRQHKLCIQGLSVSSRFSSLC